MHGLLCGAGAVWEHLMSSRFLKLPTVWWATLEAGQSGVGSRTTSLSPILACSTQCKLHHHHSGRHAVTKAGICSPNVWTHGSSDAVGRRCSYVKYLCNCTSLRGNQKREHGLPGVASEAGVITTVSQAKFIRDWTSGEPTASRPSILPSWPPPSTPTTALRCRPRGLQPPAHSQHKAARLLMSAGLDTALFECRQHS